MFVHVHRPRCRVERCQLEFSLVAWFMVATISALALIEGAPARAAVSLAGFVYVMTNQTAGNTIIQFGRANDGALTKLHEVSTGGLGGTGNGVGALDPLGSQDSLVVSDAGSLLVAVNAGNNTVSSLAAGAGGVALLSNVASGGSFPNSAAVSGTLLSH